MSKLRMKDFINEVEERKTAGIHVLAPLIEQLVIEGNEKILVESREFKELETFEKDFEEDLNLLLKTSIICPDHGDGHETNFAILAGFNIVTEEDNTKVYMIEFGSFFTWAVQEYIKPVATNK